MRYKSEKFPKMFNSQSSLETTNVDVIFQLCLVFVGIYFCVEIIRLWLKNPSLLVEPFFMPGEGKACIKKLYDDLQNATMTIRIASYWFTHLQIIMALRLARQRNVSVEVIFDKSTPNVTTLEHLFHNTGITFIESDIDAGRMHNKFIVIDEHISWIGSANLTGAAFNKNYENMVRIESYKIAKLYAQDFKTLTKELGQPNQSLKKSENLSYENLKKHSRALHSIVGKKKPISDYQRRVLNDFGLDWQGLDYDQAYIKIDKTINSAWRLFKQGTKKNYW
ncbi:hypothetical protein Noda2021_05810 [Candidatus Dependentiae bacterium Noda2021]|nr:hypothetical protein Noda2021_05810 [Candidatus Dependentiae bacterium Noda2021]